MSLKFLPQWVNATTRLYIFFLELCVLSRLLVHKASLPQVPASLPSDRLWLRVSYSPVWQVISSPPPLGDQEGSSMEGSQPQPATWGQERGTDSSSSNNSTSTPAHQPVQPAAHPSSCHHTASDVQ